MKKPKTHKEWAEESLDAFKKAYQEFEDGTLPIKDKFEIFRYAPILASIQRNINGTDRGMEMLSVIEDIEKDFTVDDKAKRNYLFYFVLAYIQCHTYADLLEDMEADRIMDYINDNYELF